MEIPNAGEITIKDLLSKVIPIHIPVKITKIKVCQIMTDIWSVLQVVVANVSICKDASHDLQRYLDLMMRIEAAARRAISEAVVFLRSYQDKKQYFDLQSTLSTRAVLSLQRWLLRAIFLIMPHEYVQWQLRTHTHASWPSSPVGKLLCLLQIMIYILRLTVRGGYRRQIIFFTLE
jgi:hypothetical protein